MHRGLVPGQAVESRAQFKDRHCLTDHIPIRQAKKLPRTWLLGQQIIPGPTKPQCRRTRLVIPKCKPRQPCQSAHLSGLNLCHCCPVRDLPGELLVPSTLIAFVPASND